MPGACPVQDPEEWGRVLAAADLADKKPKVGEDGSTTVTLNWTFTGGEIGHHELTVRRTVWAENPEDLTSPMHYDIIEVVDGEARDPLDQVSPAAQEAYGVLARQKPGRMLTAAEVHKCIADERHDEGRRRCR